MQSRGVRRPSARSSVSILRKSLLLPEKWLHHDQTCNYGPQTGLHLVCSQDQGGGQRSRDTSTFGISQKSLLPGCMHPDQTQSFPNPPMPFVPSFFYRIGIPIPKWL